MTNFYGGHFEFSLNVHITHLRMHVWLYVFELYSMTNIGTLFKYTCAIDNHVYIPFPFYIDFIVGLVIVTLKIIGWKYIGLFSVTTCLLFTVVDFEILVCS